MKINKKYEPKKVTQVIKLENSDYLFPIFLPSYGKISGVNISKYLLQSLFWKQISQRIGKVITPYFISGVSTLGGNTILEGKEKLPFPAKLQRLSAHKKKLYKKNLGVLSQVFFSTDEKGISEFSLNDDHVQQIFRKLEEKGVLKRSNELVYWDIKTQSIVQPDDIEWREEDQRKLVVKCFVETKNDVFPLVVDDPMLLFSDVGVVVHANDKRYKKHIGKKIIIPVINKPIPIIGAQGIDTIKDNGIQRLNPLLDKENLERVKSLGLSIHENYIDDFGNFSEKVNNFGGKSIFEFTENIVETLENIGNLESQSIEKKMVPYSKGTGQRLIKKIVSTIVIDTSDLWEEYKSWLQTYFPEYKGEHEEKENFIIESFNAYGKKLILSESENETISVVSNMEEGSSIFAKILINQLIKGNLPKIFTIEELIDLIFLIPEEEWLSATEGINDLQEKDILKIKESYKAMSSEDLIEELQKVLIKENGILENEEGEYEFHEEILLKSSKLYALSCNDAFLQALSLFQIPRKHLIFHIDQIQPQTLKYFLFFCFLIKEDEQILIFPSTNNEFELIQYPEKYQKIVEEYGWETLRLLFVQQEKFSEQNIKEAYEYLKHLWNLFKMLYEGGVFEEQESEYYCDGKDMRIISEWGDLSIEIQSGYYEDKNFPLILKKIQQFTREKFTRYLTLIKESNDKNAMFLARKIYKEILDVFAPIIPEFIVMVESVLKKSYKETGEEKIHEGKKDYKINLLFDMFQGIAQKKQELELKKHIPVSLAIQANPDIMNLINSHESSIKLLFKIQEITYVATNEKIEKSYNMFELPGIIVGIKQYQEEENDPLEQRERELKEKYQSVDYLRSMLVALSMNPLTPQEKIKEKEQELDKINSEIQYLEIKIKKVKMEKKS